MKLLLDRELHGALQESVWWAILSVGVASNTFLAHCSWFTAIRRCYNCIEVVEVAVGAQQAEAAVGLSLG